MIRSAVSRRLVALACVVVTTAMAFVGTSVLCVAAGGHVDLEGLFESCCGSDPFAVSAADVPAAAPTFVEVPPCDGCIDVAFCADRLATRAREGSCAAAAPAIDAGLAFVDLAAPHPSMSRSIEHAPPRSSVALSRLQGILLRC